MRQEQMRQEIPKTIIRTSNNSKLDDLKTSMKSMNITLKEDVYKMEKLERENESLKELVIELQKAQNLELRKMNDIKQEISNEFELLRLKNDEIDLKFEKLNNREIEINKEESELKNYINQKMDL